MMISISPLAAVSILLITLSQTTAVAPVSRRSPPLPNTFSTPLHIPTVKQPQTTYTNPATNVPIDFYTLTIRPSDHTFFPSLAPAPVLGYDGTFPGPTFRVKKGRESVVRVLNNATANANLHLHGSYTRAPWDGWAGDVLQPGEYKDYYYPNSVSGRTLWYHDHAHKANALNAYNGMFGMYQIVDEEVDRKVGVESGGKYDVPLMFSSHYFTKEGHLSDERKERSSVYGDTWLVNGGVQPYLEVEPTRYRFRVLNGAISRVLNFTIHGENGAVVPVSVIGSDGGAREGPVQTKSLIAGMAERWEIVVDFAAYSGKNLTLRATSMWTDPTFADSDQIMQFQVGPAAAKNAVVEQQPLQERFSDISLRFPTTGTIATREFKLVSHMDMMWGINNYHMDESLKRVLMRPPLGTIERYIFRSSGMSMGGGMGGMGGMNMNSGQSNMPPSNDSKPASTTPSTPAMPKEGGHSSHHGRSVNIASAKFIKRQHSGGSGSGNHQMGMPNSARSNYWTHAMHLHLVDMRLVSRRKEDPSKPEGRDYLEPYEQDSVKDLVLLGSNEVIEVLVKFQPYPGVYMWHCHNEIHEDRGMMAVMNITRLPDFGYSTLDTRLEDPLDARFAPRKWTAGALDLQQVKTEVLPMFADLNAYPDPVRLERQIAKYWGAKGGSSSVGGAQQTGESVVPSTDPEKQAVHKSHHGKSSDGGSMGGMGGMGGMSSGIGGMGSTSASSGSGIMSSSGSLPASDTMPAPSTGMQQGLGNVPLMQGSGQMAGGMSGSGHNSHHG